MNHAFNPQSPLNYRLTNPENSEAQGECLVLIHGLFGSMDNLGGLERELKQNYQVLSVDLPNHGKSAHTDEINYDLMARAILDLLAELNIETYSLIGHSMGGKVAMKMASVAPQKTAHLIVLDMSPVAYHVRRHDNVFKGLQAVIAEKPTSRQQALKILDQHIDEYGVSLFLAKSLYSVDPQNTDKNTGQNTAKSYMTWRFNADGIINNYENIMTWQASAPVTTPTLFVKGELSDYLSAEHQHAIAVQFPNSKAHVVAGTGHWLHAEKPQEVIRVIKRFLS